MDNYYYYILNISILNFQEISSQKYKINAYEYFKIHSISSNNIKWTCFTLSKSTVHMYIIQDVPEFLGQTGRKIIDTQRNNFGTAMWGNAKETKMSILLI